MLKNQIVILLIVIDSYYHILQKFDQKNKSSSSNKSVRLGAVKRWRGWYSFRKVNNANVLRFCYDDNGSCTLHMRPIIIWRSKIPNNNLLFVWTLTQ